MNAQATGAAGESNLALAARVFAWCNLGVLAAFLVNNFLNSAYGWPGAALTTATTSGLAWLQFAFYVLAIAIGAAFVMTNRDVTLRRDAGRITAINTYFIRAAFWMVVIVGVADATISFLRIEGLMAQIVGGALDGDLGRAHFRGFYVHLPLIGLAFIVAAFTRSLGFIWLGLLIVVAELLIVISRFVFSYEQAFMADLVRFWYAALFLFASAYTLIEEGHVRVDVFYAGFANKTKGMVNALGSLFLGVVLCWTILLVGMGAKTSIINAPVFNFEVTQSSFGMYVKYLMAAFLGIFAISMMIEFCGYMLSAIADWREEPGHVDHEASQIS